jgi:hypothetical protein
MTIRLAAALGERLNELRFEPIAKRSAPSWPATWS